MHVGDFEGGGGAPEQPQVALAPHNNNFIVVSQHPRDSGCERKKSSSSNVHILLIYEFILLNIRAI